MVQEMKIESVADLIEAARHVWTTARSAPWFRGQSRLKDERGPWKLVPKAFRGDLTFDIMRRLEVDRCNNFILQAPVRYARCPSNDDRAAWLALMQHHGLATRLLDWTGSILVGAYHAVAVKEHDGDPGVIWLLDPQALNANVISTGQDHLMPFLTDVPAVSDHCRCAFNVKCDIQKVSAVVPQESHPRIMLQQSRFTIHGLPKPLEDIEGSEAFLKRMLIPETAKRRIREELVFCGIGRSTLFPDLDSLAFDSNV
jgi:hypothetical protein